MRPGDEWRIFVPADLGYGDQGGGPIPPGATLVFRIELIDVLPGPRHKSGG
jgi:peptidylprolyl isomerase/FKBP-type peptidyl-prolyl cis-trans isomerase FklB